MAEQIVEAQVSHQPLKRGRDGLEGDRLSQGDATGQKGIGWARLLKYRCAQAQPALLAAASGPPLLRSQTARQTVPGSAPPWHPARQA